MTLPSGLQYRVVEAGTGQGGRVALSTPCSCNYRGTLIDGTEFDSSYKRGKPATFAPKQVIPGWTEALCKMREGAKWELFVPAELGYGGRGSGNKIGPGAVLIFSLEILRIN